MNIIGEEPFAKPMRDLVGDETKLESDGHWVVTLMTLMGIRLPCEPDSSKLRNGVFEDKAGRIFRCMCIRQGNGSSLHTFGRGLGGRMLISWGNLDGVESLRLTNLEVDFCGQQRND